MKVACPRCSREFTCLHGTGSPCACTDVQLTALQRDYIARNWQGCLCADCLRDIGGSVHHADVRTLSNFLLDFSTTMLSAGAHTSRVVRNTVRIAFTMGFQAEMTIFQKHITMTVIDDSDDSIRRTSVRAIPPVLINFDTVARLSSLSWEAYDHDLTLSELIEKYRAVIARPRMNRWLLLALVSVANAAFCRLFGGDAWAVGVVFAATLCGFFVRQQMNAHHLSHYAVFTVSSFVASIIAASAIWMGLGATPQIALATSVLFLIPGVPLLNAVLDLIEGHVLMGISRAVNAISLIICISLGLSATLLLLGKNVLL